jgi:hypothetical protein
MAGRRTCTLAWRKIYRHDTRYEKFFVVVEFPGADHAKGDWVQCILCFYFVLFDFSNRLL